MLDEVAGSFLVAPGKFIAAKFKQDDGPGYYSWIGYIQRMIHRPPGGRNSLIRDEISSLSTEFASLFLEIAWLKPLALMRDGVLALLADKEAAISREECTHFKYIINHAERALHSAEISAKIVFSLVTVQSPTSDASADGYSVVLSPELDRLVALLKAEESLEPAAEEDEEVASGGIITSEAPPAANDKCKTIEGIADAKATQRMKIVGRKRKHGKAWEVFDDDALEVGMWCQSRYRGLKTWKAGVIARVHSDGSVDVKYDTFSNQSEDFAILNVMYLFPELCFIGR